MTANLAGWETSEDEEKMRKWRSTSRLVPMEYKSRVIVSYRVSRPNVSDVRGEKLEQERNSICLNDRLNASDLETTSGNETRLP